MKKKVGRPSDFNETLSDKIIELAKQGKTDEQISQIIGVHPVTLGNWKRKHNEFRWSLNEAKQAADDLVEAALFSRATGYSHREEKWFQHEGSAWAEETIKHYPPDTTAGIFWLKNRQPDRWRDKLDVNLDATVSLIDAMSEARLRAQKRLSQAASHQHVIDVTPQAEQTVSDDSGEKLTLPKVSE